MGERTSSKDVIDAFKSWKTNMSNPEMLVMTKKMNEVKRDSAGRNLRDRSFSHTSPYTEVNLLAFGLKPGASLNEAIEAYKKDYAAFKQGSQSIDDSALMEKKLQKLTDLHIAYDAHHGESDFQLAKTSPTRPPPLEYQPLSHQEKILFAKFGIKEDATSTEIKAALKKPLLENHPDKGGSKEAMQEIVDGPLAVSQLRRKAEEEYLPKMTSKDPRELLGIKEGQSRLDISTSFQAKLRDDSLSLQDQAALLKAMQELNSIYKDQVYTELRNKLNT